ncbi:NTF2-like N-terminal transpeptidase domain-containing protein [Streptosporangium lutulentum]
MKRRRLAGVAALILVPVAAAGAGMWVLHSTGSAEETARDFLAAWGRQDYPAMRALTVEPPGDFDRWYTRFRTDLKVSGADFEVTGSTDSKVAFHATLKGPVNWSYDGSLTLVEHDRAWRVKWSPAAVYPGSSRG